MVKWPWEKSGDPGKAAKSTTPPKQEQRPKYAPKKAVKADKPKKGK